MKAPCSIDGCDRLARTRAMCGMHYQRWKKFGGAGSAEPQREPQEGACSVEGCTTPAARRGMCQCHYQRTMKHGDASTVLNGPDVATVPRDQASCPECGASLAGMKRNAVYCSRTCKTRAHSRAARKDPRPVRIRKTATTPRPRREIEYPPECDGMTADELRKWRYENTEDGERRRARARDYYARNKEQQALYTRNYSHANRDKRAAQNARRAALKVASGPIAITAREWRRLRARFRGGCAYCGQPCPRPHMDHVVPLARGGRHAPSNILPACPTCNVSKRDHLLSEWRLRISKGGNPHSFTL